MPSKPIKPKQRAEFNDLQKLAIELYAELRQAGLDHPNAMAHVVSLIAAVVRRAAL